MDLKAYAPAAGPFLNSQELKNWLQCKEWHTDVHVAESGFREARLRQDKNFGQAQNPLHDHFNIEIHSQPGYNINQHVL